MYTHLTPQTHYGHFSAKLFLTDVYTFDTANTLWTFFSKTLASWKIFGNWVCTCHCTVVFVFFSFLS